MGKEKKELFYEDIPSYREVEEEEMRTHAKNLQPCPNCKSRNVTVIETIKNKWYFEYIKYGTEEDGYEEPLLCTNKISDEISIKTVCTECGAELRE